MVFLGGAVLADIMKDKDGFWMTRQEYQEKGLKVLEKLGVKVGQVIKQKAHRSLFTLGKRQEKFKLK